MTDLDTVRTLIARHDAGWNTQDPDEILATYTTDIVFQNHTAGEAPVVGAEAVRAHLGGIFERWPDMQFTFGASTSSRRRLRQRVDGARDHVGRASFEWDGVDVFPIVDGLIARKDVYSTSHIARQG